jgi:hypothetical protein
MTAPNQRAFESEDGQFPGWTGHAIHAAPVANAALVPSDTTIYDPPLRLVTITGQGNLVFTLHGDDETDANAKCTEAVNAGERIGIWAIRRLWAATTATGIKGYT